MKFTQKQALDLFLPIIESEGKCFRKSVIIDARPAVVGETIITIINGEKETQKTAELGDMVITNPGGEEYIIPKDKFFSRYEITDDESDFPNNKRYRAKGRIKCVEFDSVKFGLGSPFYFVASWDEEMLIKDGDMIVTTLPEKNEVYRIERKAFEDTYKEEF